LRRDDTYEHGVYVECRILKFDIVRRKIDVSLRPSRIQGDLDDDPEPRTGDVVHGFVVVTNKKGCFVRMSRNVEGRSTIKEMCDGFLPNPEAAFPAGRLVVVKVKNTSFVQKQEDSSKDAVRLLVDLDMRESVLLQQQENRLVFGDISKGEKYKGTVQRVEDYGVFVQIDESNVCGLTHVSECSDDFVKNLSTLFNPGDRVKVLVVKKDEEGQKVGFSMKASHFVDDDDSSESSIDSDMKENVDMETLPDPLADMDDDDDDDDDKIENEEDENNCDDENLAKKLASKMGSENHDGDRYSSDSTDSEVDDDSSSEEGANWKTKVLDTDVGFSWGPSALQTTRPDTVGGDPESSDDGDSDPDTDDDQDDGPSKSHNSRKRQAQKRREEQETSRREIALADGTADENPETAGDFERLLAGEPNNAELWIRYMAFHLSLADVPAARKVADKALERIEFRQEREKLNVWSALLNLEYKYGSDKTFVAAVDRACKQNNSKQVYLRACEILESDLKDSCLKDPNAVARVDDLFVTMCRKHKTKKKAWLAHLQYLLKQSRHQEAHALMKRAMLSLAPYKHAETMSKFAQMEFELGSPERGRTLFDGLLVRYPKRLDVLFVYLDKEVKYGTIDHARSILETKVQESKLSDKQMKSLFKKWYKLEEDHGTEDSRDHVKESARTYVSSGRK
jgi:rRNA biogenesis protein RRP5